MRSLRPAGTRVAGILVFVLALLPLGATPAAAHGGGLEPQRSLPRVVGLDPPVAGLAVEVIEAGARLRIDNGTPTTVEVLAPPSATRPLELVVPPGGTARWADPRIVAAASAVQEAGVRGWSIPLTVGEQAVTIRGEQVWPPHPATGVWWLATAVAALAMTVLGVAAVRRRPAAVAVAVATLVVVGAHAIHVLGASLVVEEQSYLSVVLGAAGIGLVAWLFGVVGVALTLAGRQFGLLLCAVAGAILAMVTAFDTVGFSAAVLPFGWSPGLDRATTVLTFGAGFGLFLTGFAVLRRLPTAVPPDEIDVLPSPAAEPR